MHFWKAAANILYMDNSVEKLHRALVTAISNERNGDFQRPVTVSEIYQQLLPYRAARSAVGFEMNADYEYALLRLLAGEGNFARLEPGEVREMLRSELESPNPNVSLFRDYANCDVWITAPPKWVFEMVDEPDPVIPKVSMTEEKELLLEDPAEQAPAEPEVEAGRNAPPPIAVPVSGVQPCVFCSGDLPGDRLVNYCPHCGSDLSQHPCPTCGETLEPTWRFCANCGTQVSAFDATAN